MKNVENAVLRVTTYPDAYGAWPGHPGLAVLVAAKSWMGGTRPATTYN